MNIKNIKAANNISARYYSAVAAHDQVVKRLQQNPVENYGENASSGATAFNLHVAQNSDGTGWRINLSGHKMERDLLEWLEGYTSKLITQYENEIKEL